MDVVIVNCFDTYEHRVDLLYEVLTQEGYTVEVLTSDFRHFEKVIRSDNKNNYKFFHAKQYKKNLSYSRLSSHVKLSKDIFNYLEKRTTPDLLWVLLPPNSFAKEAAKYKKNHKEIKLVFDLIDLWPETMPVGSIKNFFPFSIWKNLRDNNLQYANFVVTECNLFQDKLNEVLKGINTKTLYLARPLEQYTPRLNLPNDRFCLCYLGSINNIIDIDEIVTIIKELKKQRKVELHIVGDGERKDELISSVEKVGSTVIFHGRVYDTENKQKIFDSCHFGLNIMKKTVCVGLTMKSMDYFEYGLPPINNIKGDTWENIERFNMGINFDGNISNLSEYDYQLRLNARRFFEDYLTINVFKKNVFEIINNLK